MDGTDCDAQYSWHVNPKTTAFGNVSIELCDGRPSYIDETADSKSYWITNVKSFCPWGAEIVSIKSVR